MLKQLFLFLIGGLIGFLFAFYYLLFPFEWTLSSISMLLFSFVLSFFLAIILHEIGHVCAGFSQGMKLLNMSVGPFIIEHDQGRLHFHFRRSSLGYLGRAMMYFPKPIERTVMRNKLIRYLYGGVVMNCVLACLSLVVAFLIWHHPFLIVFGIVNLLLGYTNLQPTLIKQVFMSDGLAIRTLRTTPVEQSILLFSYLLMTETVQQPLAKQLPVAYIEQTEILLQHQRHEPMAKSLLQTLSYAYLPADADKMVSLCKPFIEEMDEPKSLYTDIAHITYATARVFTNDVTSAPHLVDSLNEITNTDPVIVCKKKAIDAFLKGDQTSAVNYLQQALQTLGEWHPLYLRGVHEKRLIQELLQIIQTPTAT